MKKLAIDGGVPVRKNPCRIMPSIGHQEAREVHLVMKSRIIADFEGSHEVADFEKLFSNYLGAQYSVALNSGTSALHAALNALGVGPGDEVITTPFTFVGSVSPIVQLGAKPVFADISINNYCLDPYEVENTITDRTKAIMPVHLYGNAANMARLSKISEAYQIPLIEDACQAHGAKFDGVKLGTIGKVGCFSFSLGKNLTTGEGGMAVTNEEDLAEKIRLLRQNGKADWRTHVLLGYNYRMTNLCAAIGLVQLQELEKMNEKRLRNAELYTEGLGGTNFVLPIVNSNVHHVYYKYPILMPSEFSAERDWFVNAVRKENVPIEEGYPYPLYEISYLERYKRTCPVSEDVSRRIINLFTAPNLSENLIKQTCKAIRKVASRLGCAN
jgi:perosamine synthetase